MARILLTSQKYIQKTGAYFTFSFSPEKNVSGFSVICISQNAGVIKRKPDTSNTIKEIFVLLKTNIPYVVLFVYTSGGTAKNKLTGRINPGPRRKTALIAYKKTETL